MKNIAIWSFVLTSIVAAITVYNQFKYSLTMEVSIPLWLISVLLLAPFLCFALYCFIIARFKRKFKIGDVVYKLYEDELFLVVDYSRYRPSVAILQKKAISDPYNLSVYNRLDFAMHEKYLYKRDSLTISERFNEYCNERIEGTMTEV